MQCRVFLRYRGQRVLRVYLWDIPLHRWRPDMHWLCRWNLLHSKWGNGFQYV